MHIIYKHAQAVTTEVKMVVVSRLKLPCDPPIRPMTPLTLKFGQPFTPTSALQPYFYTKISARLRSLHVLVKMGRFDKLPAELQIHIFSYLDCPGLKEARAVCRKFRDNASPALFRKALACQRYLALSTLQKISLHPVYASYVKEIIFDGSVYDPWVARNEETYHRLAGQCPGLAHGFFYNKHQRYV
jgi:hypothetical protein